MSADWPSLRWSDLQPHLRPLLGLEPRERESLLSQLSLTQPAVAALVRELLEPRTETGGGYSGVPLFADTLDSQPTVERGHARRRTADEESLQAGTLIGPYRLLNELGCGGMSSVWLAERIDGQLKRQVALKLPASTLRMQKERFARERDLLAALTHPQIARLYDAGITDSGQPYLAMEYIAGTALIESCDARRLPVRARLQLFQQVLAAVQFAHAQLIIHRDLKPSNILVTEQDRAVLLDFGIAKLMTDGIAQATELTQLGGRALTPDYASPEQIKGQPLGIASDIYSLGVVLYELLTGARPYRPRRETLAALEDAIVSDDALRPSQSAITEGAAQLRGTARRPLSRALTGDLDTIVLKALRKQPHERYESVTAFAADIDNYLQRLPVSARPAKLSYRAQRFVARHKLPVIAASAVLCALLGGAGVAIWQAQLATAARDRAAVERDRAVLLAARNEATSEFLNTVLLQSANADKPITIHELRERSEALALGNKDDLPENRAAILQMLAQSYVEASDWEHADRLVDSALGLLTRSSDQTLKSQLSCSRAFISSQRGEPDVAVPKAVAALQAEVAKLEADPNTASECLLMLVQACQLGCSTTERLRYAQDGIQRLRNVPGAGKTEALLLALAGNTVAEDDQYGAANDYYARAMRTFTENGTDRSGLALLVLVNWAQVVGDAGVPLRALSMYERKLRIEAERDPTAKAAPVTLLNYAKALIDAGRLPQSRAALDRLLQQEAKPELLMSVSILLAEASLQMASEDMKGATRSLARIDELRASNQTLAQPLQKPRTVLALGIALARRELSAAREQLALLRPKDLESRAALSYYLTSADIEDAAGNPAASAHDSRLALKLATSFRSGLPYTKQVGVAWFRLGRAQMKLGEQQAARESLRSAVLHLSNTVAEENPVLVKARQLLEP